MKTLEKFCSLLQSLLAQIPYQLHIPQEKYYHSLFKNTLSLLSLEADSEICTDKGRIDIVLKTKTHIYIFELKFDSDPETALKQIEAQRYYEKYLTKPMKIVVVGLAFNRTKQVLTTKVVSVDGNDVTFEATIAFSFAGGQESDKATINELPILDSRMEGKLIIYTLQEGHGLCPGEQVTMKIDWPRRYKLMRYHFAAELILELVTRKLGLEKIGAHIAETKARIDFVYDQNISSIFQDILVEYNHIIEQDLMIKKGFSDVETQRRFWEIEGFSKVPCGGTHVRSTAEVGFVTLKRKNIGGSKERIDITLIDSQRTCPDKGS